MADRPASGAAPTAPPPTQPPLRRLAMALLLLTVFSLAFMRPGIFLFGSRMTPTDFVFLPLLATWAAALLLGQCELRWNRAHWLLGFYFAAMAASAIAAQLPLLGAPKLATQVYLLSLPVIANSLLGDVGDMRRIVRAWLGGTAVVAAVGAASLAVFAVDPGHPALDLTRFHFGTLPPGAYFRLSATFMNANMLCNYLTVSLLILLAARRAGWVSKWPFVLLLAGILVAAAFTFSPGLGGIALAGGVWLWLSLREERPGLARLGLAAGLAAAILAVPAMAVTPILHPTAPFLLQVPGLAITLAPAGRLMVWISAAREFLEHPLLGHGIGVPPVTVRYLSPSGVLQTLTDAHNTFLSIAAQCGLAGLAALLLLLAFTWRRTLPLRFLRGNSNAVRLALGFAFLNGLAYQGLGGAFEDARHLWVLFGLFLASIRLEEAAPAPGVPR